MKDGSIFGNPTESALLSTALNAGWDDLRKSTKRYNIIKYFL